MRSIDFLAVGDIVTEPFIKLIDAKVHCNLNEDECTISMRWGDKIPYESAEVIRAVGNSANAAVSASRLGLTAALVSDIGNDEVGRGNIAQLMEERVMTDFVRIHPGMKSNYHYVLWYESERSILVKHEVYPYRFPDMSPAPRWVYLSSLSEHSEAYHEEIAAYLGTHPETRFAFQPGTFQMKLGFETLKNLYARTELFFVNKEEARRILKLEGNADIKELLQKLHALGPQKIVITDNRNGAYAFDGTRYFFVPLYPDVRAPFERTGAGDAFASSVTSAIALGKSFEDALLWGPINSMSVVQEVGAQKGLLTRTKLEAYLAQAPAEYGVSEY
ncbi:MAG: carbohydrate kinase family protein [Minisyncoccia bacterium]